MSDSAEPLTLLSDPAIISSQPPDTTTAVPLISLDKPSPVTDRDYFFVTVKLPTGGTTDPLPLLISDLVYFIPFKGNAHFNKNWEQRLLSRVFDCVRNHFDTHDLDPDDAYFEHLQALFYQGGKDLTLQFDRLTQLFFDPDNNKVPVYPKTLLERLFGYDNYKFGDNPTEIPPGGPLSL
jgi:hypothetical protein